MRKNLAVNVLTWNDWENTIICLESIYQSNYDNFDIILIDNNSDKSHLEKIYDWSKNNIQVEDKEFKFNQHKKRNTYTKPIFRHLCFFRHLVD